MNEPKLSAVVTTLNSARTLERTLQSLDFVDEVIVVDSGSQDATAALAQQYSAQYMFHEWEGYGLQKNFGMQQATGDWVLFLDADEEVTPLLAKEIQELLTNTPEYGVYWINITDIFLGYRLSHLHGNNPRLLRKGAAMWDNSPVHEGVVLSSGEKVKLGDANSGRLQQIALHNSYESVSAYVHKMHIYTSLDAQKTAATNRHRSGRRVTPWFGLPFILAFRQFIKLLFYRQGILDGVGGIIWSTLSAYYEWELGWKYISLVRSKKSL